MASNCIAGASENFVFFSDPMTVDKLKDKARTELNETSELKEECLQQLRILLRDHNVTCITRDDFLLRFLRTKKFEIQRSFESVQSYAKQRVDSYNSLQRLKPEVMKMLLQLNFFGVLPYRDSKERLIFFYRSGIWNPNICTEEEFLMSIFSLLNYASDDQISQISGIVFIVDHSSFSFSNMVFFMRHVNFLRNLLLKSLPARYSRIHVVNDSALIKCVLQVIESFVPHKLRTRILFHGKDREVLFQHISPAILPSDFGGTHGPLTNEHLVPVMEDYLTKLKDEEYYFFDQRSA